MDSRTLWLGVPLAVTSVAGADPGLWLTGLAPGTTSGRVCALLQDASGAVGYCAGWASSPGFTWDRSTGRYDFGLEPGMPAYTSAFGVSSDGGVVVGEMYSGNSYEEYLLRHAYRWTVGTGLQDLGVLPGGKWSYASDVSGNGLIAVGAAESKNQSGIGQAFRWTAGEGMVSLGKLQNGSQSFANGISRDGSTIVGDSGSEAWPFPFVWTQAGGMKQLLPLPKSSKYGSAQAADADGSVIVGMADGEDDFYHAVRWVDGAIEDLSGALGHDAKALAVSDLGNVIAGTYASGLSFDTAFVWTKDTGLVDLKKFLMSYGIDVPGWCALRGVYAISADGLTFAGEARNLVSKMNEGFVVTIPAPAAGVLLLAPLAWRRRRGT